MAIAVFALSFLFATFILCMFSFSHLSPRPKRPRPLSSTSTSTRGYVLHCKTTHARFLPTASRHAFSYPTLSLFVSLNALENHSLDLGSGWIFGYDGGWGITTLRPSAYFHPNSHGVTAPGSGEFRSIREKLVHLLDTRGYHGNLLEDAWMLSMPRFLGYEGINPLTVYFCYSKGQLWIVILETHNTFGERHVDVLVVGRDEDDNCAQGFDHQWTFPRGFHVSPFNDRTGFYRVSVTQLPELVSALSPSRPGSPISSLPHPSVRVQYLAPDPSYPASSPRPGPLKLSATLRTTTSAPLTSQNLLLALLRRPFALLLTLVRVYYQAWVLHYVKRLDVYPRPDPYPAVPDWGGSGQGTSCGGGIGWQPEGFLERYSRRLVEEFLTLRVNEVGISVTLISGDPSVPRKVFEPKPGAKLNGKLDISYLSPRFFSTLFLSPSARHAFLLGSTTENLFVTSSPDLFSRVFGGAVGSNSHCTPPVSISLAQRIRLWAVPSPLSDDTLYPIPARNVLDARNSFSCRNIGTILFLSSSLTLETLERIIFTSLRARFLPGEEPWKRWDRALRHM